MKEDHTVLSETTAPIKGVNMIMRKLSVKKSKSYENHEEKKTVPLKLRSCVVKLRRVPMNTLRLFNSSDNNTLQKTYKINSRKNQKLIEDVENNVLLNDEFNSREYSLANNCPVAGGTKVVDEENKGSDCLKLKAKNVTGGVNTAVLKPITNKISAKKIRTTHNENSSALKMVDVNMKQKPGDIKSIRKAAVRARNFLEVVCRVKDQNKQTTKKKKKDVLETSSSICKRRCVVKLRRTPLSKSGKLLIEPSPYKIRKCAVNLSKLRFLKANVDTSDYAKASIIDKSEHKNLYKLSLTKPLTKLTKYKDNSNTNVRNVKDTLELTNKHNNNTEAPVNIAIFNQNNEFDKQKSLLSSDEYKPINHVKKLSLKRQSAIVNINVDTQLDDQHNSSIRFEPVRNSTLLEASFPSGNLRHKISTKLNKKSVPTEDKFSCKNFANKSEEIEDLLSSLDNEDENVCISLLDTNQKKNVATNEENIPTINNKTKKFFHYKKDISENISKESSTQHKYVDKNRNGNKRRSYAKRSNISKQENIYEFLSQSQTSESNSAKLVDPTADIIKKLIEQGKVRVATNCKGKGKPKFKPKKPLTREKKKIKKAADKKLNYLKNNTKKVTFVEENDYDSHEENQNFVDDFDNMETYQKPHCSDLAKRALMNHISQENRLAKLEMIKKIISTPKNTKTLPPPRDFEADISPIVMAPHRPMTKASPWRINEDAHLPATFNFCRSSGNLPSFSSDIISEKPYEHESNERVLTRIKSPTAKENVLSDITSIQKPVSTDAQSKIPCFNGLSLLSSFSSNDSNAENMPPSRKQQENYNENDNIFDFKQLPNPRRILSHRSPLKYINILEVVHLPPVKLVNKAIVADGVSGKQIKMIGPKQNLENLSLQPEQHIVEKNSVQQKNVDLENTKYRPKDDLFGFEDFLSQTEYNSQGNECNDECINYDSIRTNNLTIHEKLQNLRKLKPDENNLKESTTNLTKNQLTLYYDEPKKDSMRQTNIKEMLCSTMLNTKPSTSKEALRLLNKRNLEGPILPYFAEDGDVSELFKDREHETTLNENDAHRTYIRPYKRKRRVNANNFVFILDSDESGDDDSHKKQNPENSLELNSSMEQSPKKRKKISRKESKENKLLTDFITEFNELVKEVDAYEIHVEKSS